MLSVGGKISLGGPGVFPREICKIGLSKMQFPAFPGPELGNRGKVFYSVKKCSQKKKYLTYLAIIIISLQLFIPKRTPIGRSVRIPYL